MISILMVHGSKTSLVDSAIRSVTKSKYAHCAVLFRLNGQETVYEVTRRGMGSVPLKDYLYTYEEWSIRRAYTPQEEECAVRFAKDLLAAGVKYGYLEIIGMYLTLFLNRLVPVSCNILDSRMSYICSEFCGEVLRKLGVSLPKDPSLLTPVGLVTSGTIEPVSSHGV
jgi:hypothetical protein